MACQNRCVQFAIRSWPRRCPCAPSTDCRKPFAQFAGPSWPRISQPANATICRRLFVRILFAGPKSSWYAMPGRLRKTACKCEDESGNANDGTQKKSASLPLIQAGRARRCPKGRHSRGSSRASLRCRPRSRPTARWATTKRIWPTCGRGSPA